MEIIFVKSEHILKDTFTLLTNKTKINYALVICSGTPTTTSSKFINITIGSIVTLPVTCSLGHEKVNFTRMRLNFLDKEISKQKDWDKFTADINIDPINNTLNPLVPKTF